MTAGLVVSIIGTRLVEGGSDGSVAAGILPVAWIAFLVTFGQAIGFASPLIARALGRYRPSSVLVLSDAVEAGVSVAAVVALFAMPAATLPILVIYLLVAAVFPAVTDIVEELYAQQLAQLDAKQALTFNTTIYSVLAFVGLVVGMPIGSVLAGQSILLLIVSNAVLSGCGTLFRLYSSRAVITEPVAAQDLEDFGVLGRPTSIRHFARDLLASGPASPLVSFATQVGATMGGIYVYLWIAQQFADPAFILGVVIALFGVGATIGPHLAPMLQGFLGARSALLVVHGSTIALLIVSAFAVSGLPATNGVWVGLVYVLLIGLLSRARAVITTTLRQESFRGAQFRTIMSWSFSFVALADVLGNWLAVAISLHQRPEIGLLAYAASVLVAFVVTVRFTPPSDGSVHP